MLYKDYRFSIVSANTDTLIYQERDDEKSLSTFGAVMILLNCGISNDPFFFPHTFTTGIVTALLLCLLALILTQLSFHIFLKSWKFDSENSFVSIWAEVFGPSTSFIPRFIMLVALVSMASVCTSDFQYHFEDFVNTWDVDGTSIFSYKPLRVYLLTFLSVFPFLFFDRFKSFDVMSTIANCALIYGLVVELYVLIKSIKADGFDPNGEICYFNMSLDKAVSCFDLFNIVFFLHPMASMVAPEIKKASRNTIISITWKTTILSAIINMAGGYLGYLTYFGNDEDDNILLFYDNQDPVVISGKAACLIAILLTNGIYTYIVAEILSGFFYDYKKDNTLVRVFSGLVVWLFDVAINYDGFMLCELINNIGSFCFIVLAFILPSVFYLIEYGFRDVKWGVISIVVICISVPISLYIFVVNMRAYVEDYFSK